MSAHEILQTTLDALLYPQGIYVFWQRKTETEEEETDEYVVYTIDGDPVGTYADDKPLTRETNLAIRYYYRDTLMETANGREKIENRTQAIIEALEAADFSVPEGAFDSGDIDDVGFGSKIIECYYWRVV